MPPIGFIILGYLLGSIPFGLLLTACAGLGDIRRVGSGNIGATNVLRTGRKGLAAATLLLDGLKGAAAVLIAGAVAKGVVTGVVIGGGGAQEAALWAGLGAVLGHLFPVWLKFQGGKGVATGYGVLFGLAWPVGLAACAIWLIMAKVGRISSLAALVSFAAAPAIAFFLADPGVVYLSFTIAVLVYARHHANIRRLLDGTEPRIGQRDTPAPQA